MCFSVKTRSCLLENTERTRKYSLHQFATKLTRAQLVKTRALFAETKYGPIGWKVTSMAIFIAYTCLTYSHEYTVILMCDLSGILELAYRCNSGIPQQTTCVYPYLYSNSEVLLNQQL